MGAKVLLAIGLLFYMVTDLSKCQAYHAALQGNITVVGVRSGDEPDFVPPPQAYPVQVVLDAFSITLEVNTCNGTMSSSSGNGLQLSGMACTRACCDSDYGQSLIRILESVNSYTEVNDKEVILNGSAGSIWLKSED